MRSFLLRQFLLLFGLHRTLPLVLAMIQAGTDFFAFPAFERRSLYARCLFRAIFLYSPYGYVPLCLLALYLSEQLFQDFVCDWQSNAPRLRYLYEL